MEPTAKQPAQQRPPDATGLPRPGLGPFLKRLWDELVLRPLRRPAEENRAFLKSARARRPDWKVMTVLVTTAVSLTLQEYLGQGNPPEAVLDRIEELTGLSVYQDGQLFKLCGLAWWALGCFVFFFALPALVVRLAFREPLRNYGVAGGDGFRHWYCYLLMLVVMGPLIWLVSMRSSFLHTYPFYRPAADEPLWPRFWCWEAFYGVQFLGIEFLFRGFMVHGLKHRFGAYGIFVMVIPYCMIHFAKPMPETFAAIAAGIVLGFMSLTTRSIWLGVAVHMSVAVTMDLTALYRLGYFA